MNTDKQRRRAADIELDREAGKLTIRWKDGHRSTFSLAHLRRICPCASCREAREKAAAVDSIHMLEGASATATADATAVERVGRYGIRLHWADGHDYGIYTLESLRALDEGDGSESRVGLSG